MSNKEAIIKTIVSALQAGLSVPVERNADRPIDVPLSGYVIVRDAAPTIEDVCIGESVWYFMRLTIPVEVYVQKVNESDRSDMLDALCDSILSIISTSSVLGLLVNYIEVTEEDIETFYPEGSTSVKAAQIGVSVDYDALTALG